MGLPCYAVTDGFMSEEERQKVTKVLPRNEGTVDRTLRVIVGVGLVSLVFVGPQTPWGWIGLLPLTTGLIGSCPAYTAFGWSTCSAKDKGE